MTALIYCADGNRRFAEIAIRHGYVYGAQLPNTVYFAVAFADQSWRKPNRAAYMAALATHRPALATVLDFERDDQLDEVLSWADEAAQYVSDSVIIIPKAHNSIARLPRSIRGKTVRLGYSVPTRFAGTEVMLFEFVGWPIHLLGGSPQAQMKLARYLDIRSADGNYAQKMATRWNQWFTNGAARYANNRYWPRLREAGLDTAHDAPYVAFELSCINIRAAWSGCIAALRWATDGDLLPVKRIANQYKQELGYVMLPALRESITRRSLLVAELNRQIVGFVNYRARKDGQQTIYEIAVDRAYRGDGIGRALLNAVPRPVQLKCTVDNAANGFYAAQGMTLARTEPGRKRALNVWRIA